MPINQDLSVSPYFDDFNEDKNYYKVLFKPGVAVQVRELNQLQTILQAQIEKFGNNIYKRGTIIDGVNFVYHPEYSYIKLLDSQLDGIPANPELYVGNFAVDPSTNLTAHIINSADGFESTNPNLKTLYLRYINSGDTGEETSFSTGATLTVYDYLDSVNKVNIGNGSSGFSNNDTVVFCSALALNAVSNTSFTVGETIAQSGNSHFAIVTAVSTAKGKSVLEIRPRTTDLTNTAISATTWQFTSGQDIIGLTSGATATVEASIGTGAKASMTTSADIGKITGIDVTARGEGYYVAPHCTIKSSGISSALGSRNYNDLDLDARNFMAQLTVASTANSVGTGYAFGVTEGVIYQKGFFVRVAPQTVLVSKYTNSPDSVAIGFDTLETLIDSNSDQDLLDNATGTRNEFAPGADRLNLEPKLVVVSTDAAAANDEFLSIVEFSDGLPYRENKRTQFNTIMDEMALRTSEEAGDYVIDKFLVTTRSTSNQSNEGKNFAVVVDPGRGYINGYRVETKTNYSAKVDKGIDSRSAANLSASVNYGNYILVNEVAGSWNCNVGDKVSLRFGNLAHYVTSSYSSAVTAPGMEIGTARIRNIVYEENQTGSSGAVYRLYLFNVQMAAGHAFRECTSVYFDNGSYDAVADIIQEYDATSQSQVAVLKDSELGSKLIVDTGTSSTKSITNLSYVYRMTSETVSVANNGTGSVLLTDPNEYFAYESASLTAAEKKSLVLVPLSGDLVLTPNTTSDGTASVSTASNIVTVSSSSVNKYAIGDFIALFSGVSAYTIRKVTAKTATTLQLDSNVGFTNGTASFSHVYPANVPVPLDRMTGASVTLTGSNKTLNINLGLTVSKTTATTCSLTYDVKVSGASPQAKTATRDNFVKLDLSSAGITGPWCLGIPDIFRLKNVYLGSSSSVNTSSTDVTDQFFIDHNQNSDYYDLGYLYKRNDANIKLNGSTWLLVRFDAFTSSPGVYTVNSYVSANTAQRFADDSLTLDNLGTKANSFEIPEFYATDGTYFDLTNCIDFRPAAANTVAYASTAAAAPTNPASTVTFTGSNKKFILPESGVSFDREHFLGRKDTVVVATDNKIKVVRGVPAESQPFPDAKSPKNTLQLNKIVIPSYPCVPMNFSAATRAILDKKMSNERLLLKRIRDKTIKVEETESEIAIDQPKGFTMADINRLERRVQDLEYTVALSLVEDQLREKVIPSNAAAGTNRFKFGFFVDDYSTKKNSDIDNIEYAADVVDSRVVPLTESMLTTHGKGFRLGELSSEVTIINQDLASEVPVIVPVPPAPETPPVVVAPPAPTPTPSPTFDPTPAPTPAPPPPSTVPTVPPAPPSETPPPVVVSPPSTTPPAPPAPAPTPVVVAKYLSMYRSYRNSTYSYADNVGWLELSSVPGTITIDYYFYGKKDQMVVTKEINGNPVTLFDQTINGRGRLTFDHDPATGRNYYFTVVRKSDKWEYTLNYPIDDIQYVDTVPPSTNINATFYTGTLVSIQPGYLSAQELGQNFGTLAYVSQGDVQSVKMASLKPNTLHKVTLSDASTGISLDPVISSGSAVVGSSMMTDEFGVLNFNLLIDNTIMSTINSLNGSSAEAAGLPSNLLVMISSPDNTSAGAFYLGSKAITTPVGTPPEPVYGGSVAVVSPFDGSGGGGGRLFESFHINSA